MATERRPMYVRASNGVRMNIERCTNEHRTMYASRKAFKGCKLVVMTMQERTNDREKIENKSQSLRGVGGGTVVALRCCAI